MEAAARPSFVLLSEKLVTFATGLSLRRTPLVLCFAPLSPPFQLPYFLSVCVYGVTVRARACVCVDVCV